MLKDGTRRSGRLRLKHAPFLALLAAAFFLGSCGNESGKQASVTIGMEATSVNSLIYIAKDRKYFADNGIRLTIKDDYPSGAAATAGMLAGETDVSTTAEFGIVRYAFARKPIRAFGSIDMFMHMKLIGRKDRRITRVSDLRGKRIGVPLRTAADFKLGRFLDLHGIDERNVTIVDVQAPRAVEALTDETVDAIIAWQPNVWAIEERLGDKAIVWDVQSGQPLYCVLITTAKWAADNVDLLKRFMKSLLQAQDYLIRNGERGKAIVQKRLGYDDTYIGSIWPEHQFSLRLDQSLILALEDQARWMIENRLTSETNVPDFLHYIYAKGLKAVKPGSVNLIGVEEEP